MSPTTIAGNIVSTTEPAFDPSVHLAYRKPENVLTMDDLMLGNVGAPSSTAITAPFRLASLEGVKALRQALLQPRVLDGHTYGTPMAGPTAMVRGMAAKAGSALANPEIGTGSTFIYDFFTHPATLAAIAE